MPSLNEDEDVTPGEILLIWRKRRALNQREAAYELGWSLHQYINAERNDVVHNLDVDINFNKLNDHERCLIYRRRAGLTQTDVAVQLGCSRLWVHKMETGQVRCDDLLWFWEQ